MKLSDSAVFLTIKSKTSNDTLIKRDNR